MSTEPAPEEITAIAALRRSSTCSIALAETKIEPSTARIAAPMELLGNPQLTYRCIIAGTNGKTSVARMVDALLTAFSRHRRPPVRHLQSAVERISIDGKPISPAVYVDTYREMEPFVHLVDAQSRRPADRGEQVRVVTAMAFAAFADAPVDVGVIEVGLGGRWDATKRGRCARGRDHPDRDGPRRVSGRDLAAIAGEKAGIIKKQPEDLVPTDTVAVVALQAPEAMEVILAQTVTADAVVAGGFGFAVLGRQTAIGGQVLELRGLGGVLRGVRAAAR